MRVHGRAHLRHLPVLAERELSVSTRPNGGWSRTALRRVIAAIALLASCRGHPPAPPAEGTAAVAAEQELPDTALGVVADVISDRYGRVYALDVTQKSIAVTDPRTGRTTRLGRPGHGPGEFVAPLALAMGPQERLMVMDPGTQRIERYQVTAERVSPDRPIPLPFPAEDLAVCDGRLFLLGSWKGFLLHEIAAQDGRILRSFAPSPVPSEDLMADSYATGYLDCAPGGALTVVPLVRPEIRRFSAATGALLATLRIPGYEAVEVSRHGAGVMYRAPRSGRHDVASSVFTLADGRQIVQVGPLAAGARTPYEFDAVRSYLVSWHSRSIRPLKSPLPRIVRVAAGSTYVVLTDPAPRIRVGRLPDVEEQIR
jgi:hypothetical protein